MPFRCDPALKRTIRVFQECLEGETTCLPGYRSRKKPRLFPVCLPQAPTLDPAQSQPEV